MFSAHRLAQNAHRQNAFNVEMDSTSKKGSVKVAIWDSIVSSATIRMESVYAAQVATIEAGGSA